MLTTSNCKHLDHLLGRREKFIVALDVEWTKNYRIKNGQRPFCYSLVVLSYPSSKLIPQSYPASFWFRSLYVSTANEEQELISALDTDLKYCLSADTVLAGHQLSSDLSVVKSASRLPVPNIQRVYKLWQARRTNKRRNIIDTRNDIDHSLSSKSRRLVDVCEELLLGVRQPELLKASMTRLHTCYLDSADEYIREKIIVLNLRHSLSTAIAASLGVGWTEKASRNVNTLLRSELNGRLEYISSHEFLSAI